MAYLSQADAAILTAARQVLTELDTAAQRDLSATDMNGYDGLRRGRFAEACEVGEAGIFRVLNVASAYLDDKIAQQAINGYNDARTEASS